MSEVARTPVTRTASVAFSVADAATGEQRTLYRCDECRALFLGGEDARQHLWWHDRILLAPPGES